MRVIFTKSALAEFLSYSRNPKALKKLEKLIQECMRTPFHGTGKPEALKGDFSGWWSRRVDQENRLVYKIEGEDLIISQCRYHYDD